MRRVAALASGALALAIPAGVGVAQAPVQGSKLTIEARPNPVNYLGSVVISGKLTGPKAAGETVELEENPYPFIDNDFRKVATTTTAANRDYGGAGVSGFTRTPLVNTQYRTVAKTGPPTTSPVVTVLVRVRVSLRVSNSTPAPGELVRFSGSVRPEHDGKVARIQRRTAGGDWATVARARLRDVPGENRSRYSRRLRVSRDAAYRVRVTPADGDHVTGTSRRRAIDVR